MTLLNRQMTIRSLGGGACGDQKASAQYNGGGETRILRDSETILSLPGDADSTSVFLVLFEFYSGQL